MYLNCHTAFSFRYGTLTVQQLFDEARRCRVRKLVLTEVNNTASYVELMRLCAKNRCVDGAMNRYGEEGYDLEMAVGVEIRQDSELMYVLIAKNNRGFEAINRFLSFHHRERRVFPRRAPEFGDVFVVYAYPAMEDALLRADEYIGVAQHQLNHFAVHASGRSHPGKYVILQPVTFASRTDFNVHRLMRAIDLNTLLSKLPVHQQARPDEVMVPEQVLEHAFRNCPALIENTRSLLSQCHIEFDMAEDKNKKQTEADWQMLIAKAWEGFRARYDSTRIDLRERFERELRIIRAKNFCNYYVIAHDLIQYANRNAFPYVGRGSGANSVVAYCLGITNVDPIDLDLYFERFLNEERTSPPDFDIDFSWDHRDAIYEYLFNRYGHEHVCLLGTHVTYQGRSILRELGKVFGLPREEIQELVDDPKKYRDRDQITRLIFRYAPLLRDLPSSLSIHAGGVLITEKPIHAFTATDTSSKGHPVAHLDMHGAEDLGIFKFDILSQRGLGHIREAVGHIRRNRGVEVDVNQFAEFRRDEKIRKLMRNGNTMGCFYVESPAMRMLLGKLKCDDYLTLVAASSIIRPGVASSGMMRAYIERFHAAQNGQRYEPIHPVIGELLKETYGVMVYQEDVIKVVHHFAGLTLTEADVLRRGMSGKYRSREEFNLVRERFFEQCNRRGYERKVAERVWYEIESFAGFSFAKGHSASYAVESYQSLFLKAHYPLEFMVSVINNFGGYYKTEFYFHEARMNGGRINPPCVNKSEYLTSLNGNHIHVGFVHVKSLEIKVANAIVAERHKHGPYRSFEDFLNRIDVGLEQLRILIRVGAFRFTGKDKQHLLWEAMLYLGGRKKLRAGQGLFDTVSAEYPLPSLSRHPIEDTFDEIELLGFSLSDPFRLLAGTERGDTVANDLPNKVGQTVHMYGYVVVTKDSITKTKHPMQFGTFLDCEGNVFDTVHFPSVVGKYPFRGRGFYEIRGKVTEDFGVQVVEVTEMQRCPIVNKRAEQLMIESRNTPVQTG